MSSSWPVTATKAPQSITFPTPGLQVVTNQTPITATASSGLPVSLSVMSGAEHLIGPIGPISPTTLTYQSPGLVTLRATQAGDAGWLAATPVEMTFRVRADRVAYADFDGDGLADLAVYHPAGGMWYLLESTTRQMRKQNWGWSEADPVPGDYDGDGVTDIAVFHQETGNWYIIQSATATALRVNWGWNETLPVWPVRR